MGPNKTWKAIINPNHALWTLRRLNWLARARRT